MGEADRFRCILGFDGAIQVDSEGKSGGLLLLWKDWDVRVQSFSKGHIDARVVLDNGLMWRFSGFYRSPSFPNRAASWELLMRLRRVDNLPWDCGGDFNEILRSKEKQGGIYRQVLGMANFRMTIDDCDLIDVGFTNPKLTWNNRRAGENNIQERLDIFFANEVWLDQFGNVDVKHLGYNNLDHRPIVLNISGASDLYRKLSACARKLEDWSKVKFGFLGKLINTKKDELERLISRAREVGISEEIVRVEGELENMLNKEEIY
ncbi:hypothetical protein EZV62_017811 [Acer yangbiense]|uniref:Endonuclease/exonuclease/phosphatase domain-containing protein n=1 Tax=Acer yangbiense TaxID=1000413 RepID=A0A5C7HI34_9ROSI|nr:hypothetical protein EZV62_017811 [Acer yangbiense]